MTDRRVTKTQSGGASQRPNGPVPPFSFGGVLALGEASAPYKFRGIKVVTSFLATLSVVDSNEIKINLWYNKNFVTPLGVIIIASGLDEAELEGPFRFLAGDYLQMQIVEAGTAAEGLLVVPFD